MPNIDDIRDKDEECKGETLTKVAFELYRLKLNSLKFLRIVLIHLTWDEVEFMIVQPKEAIVKKGPSILSLKGFKREMSGDSISTWSQT